MVHKNSGIDPTGGIVSTRGSTMQVNHRTLLTPVALLLMLLAFVASCERPRPQQESGVDDAYFVQVEKTPGKDNPSSDAAGLRQAEIVTDAPPQTTATGSKVSLLGGNLPSC